jgi:signal transduction histidine kinase/ActR/RegA family two-component response regulator
MPQSSAITSSEPAPRPSSPAEERAGLVEKYRRLVEKHESLVRRYREDVEGRSTAVTMSSAALRATRSGLALVGRTGFQARNARWLQLAASPGPWRDRDGVEHARIEPVVAALGASLCESPVGTLRGERFERAGPIPCVVDIRLERVDVHGRPVVTAIADDVTERVLRERDVERARSSLAEHERIRVVGELASGVAHDLNNTMHALSLRLSRLRASPRLGDEERADVERLARIVADAAERVSRLQEFGRRREDVPTGTFDVKAVVREAIEIVRPEIEERAKLDGVRYSLEVDLPSGVQAFGQASDLQHVFVNLLVNARDAMKRGGRIRVAGRTSDSSVEVRVEDEGCGIDPQHLSRIFDPFFTTKGRRGVGMGLAIAAGVMRRLGGSISAANRPEGGAVLTLVFPIAREPAPAAVARPRQRLDAGHRLLVVDDDAENLEATKLVLEDMGQTVDVAASGAEALALVGGDASYDLVLCDVGMPDMTGWRVAEAIRRASPSTRILMVSGWAQEIAPDDPKLRGVDGLLGKPLGVEALREAIADGLSHPAAPA